MSAWFSTPVPQKLQSSYVVGLIGYRVCGGSSLLKYLHDGTPASDSFISLVGLYFAIKNVTHNDNPVALQFIDSCVARHALGYATVREHDPSDGMYSLGCTFKKSAVFLICFDLCNRENFEKLPFLLEKLDKCPVKREVFHCVLVGTKADLAEQRAISSEEAESFARLHSMQYLETSAKTGEGCDKIIPMVLALLPK